MEDTLCVLGKQTFNLLVSKCKKLGLYFSSLEDFLPQQHQLLSCTHLGTTPSASLSMTAQSLNSALGRDVIRGVA